MEDNELLEQYKKMIPFLEKLLGSGCEILLHDVSDPKHSTIAAANGWLSGRSIGSPLTDFGLRVIRERMYEGRDYLSNYSGAGQGKRFISSTFFIKNNGRLIGMMCVNRDISTMMELETVLGSLKSRYNLETTEAEINENLDAPIPVLIHNIVAKAINDMGILPEHMSVNERIALIGALKKQGILEMKGAVIEIAAQLGVSVPTIYRYMKKTV